MPAPRKPKKVLVQFAIALVVAVVFGGIAILVGFSVISGVSSQAQQAKEDAAKKAAAAEEELERIKKMQDALEKAPKNYKVVQAIVDLVPGQPITKDMVTIATVNDRPASGTLSMISQSIGRVVKSPIMSGEALEASKLIDTGGFISVEPGKRAITIEVDSVGGLNGALNPGAYVDVLTAVTHEDSTIVKTLLQNVQVVSVDGNNGNSSNGRGNKTASTSSGGAQAVTVIVNPKQAELLALAGQLGKFHLTLRGFSDKQSAPVGGADLNSLLTGMQPGALKQNLPNLPKLPSNNGFQNVNYSPNENLPMPSENGGNGSKFTMQIYRGTGAETVDFQQ